MKNISFLIGSGFSVPDKMMSVSQINNRFSSIKKDEIYINSDKTFVLLNGQTKPLSSQYSIDEDLFIDFIQYYINQNGGNFDYEDFYDFITSFVLYNKNKEEIFKFFENFKTNRIRLASPTENMDAYMPLFIEYFNKLLSELLQSKKYHDDANIGDYPPYDSFMFYLRKLIDNKFIISVHSLNHDILFEHLASKHVDLSRNYCDGFCKNDSRYYGQLNIPEGDISKAKRVRLKCFQNRFNKPIRLYKLHGSVDTYIANVANPNPDFNRIKKDWGVGYVRKKIKDTNTGEMKYLYTYQLYPDILSGKSSKILWYKQSYYKDIFKAFKNNLKKSEKLFVIGYGFKDDGINHILEQEYLIKQKKMIVIDIAKPNNRLTKYYNYTFVQKSISDLSIDEWLKFKN